MTDDNSGIKDLREVKNVLENFNDWESLGLELGLLYPTLERIEMNDGSNVTKCMTKMIAAWLNKQDNVSEIGDPSWSVLKRALIKIKENTIAEQIPIPT